MPAPLFSADEVKKLIAVRKHVEHEGKHRRLPNREGELQKLPVSCDELPGVKFYIQQDRPFSGCHFTLSVKMDDSRPEQAIARYDIHPPAHANPDGTVMQPMVGHRHIYLPEMVTQFGAWDRVAEPLNLPKHVCDLLWSRFLTDLDIHFSDTDTQLFSFEKAR